MRKTLIVLFLCVVMASTIGATAVATAARPQISTPHLVAPKNTAEFTTSDLSSVTFEWTAVHYAVSYSLEFQYYNAKVHYWIPIGESIQLVM